MEIQVKSNMVPSSEAIREQVQRILSSRTLVQSKRLARFLRFVVEKGIAGDSDQLNEYMVGTEVYQRASSFDPQTDTIVRTEARRLRSKLRQYYDTEGVNDPILIEVPKGSYAPLFRTRDRAILEKTAGQLIAHYRLVGKLGEGAMGSVYLAEDTRLGRQVALKFIHSAQLKEKDAKIRMIREARAAAAIDHPNVAPVYEVGEMEGQPFIAMAYVKGQNLADRILDGPLEIRDALNIACQLSQGLQAAHKHGVIHRDLSPSNVILSHDGRVRIVDFGVARLADGGQLTEPGTSLGTAHYVSPEQMKGDAVDQRTDIWSLGVILYELVTGKRPFQGAHREAIYYAIALKNPAPMRDLGTGIPVELERIVLKCLEKERADRYPDAAELINDLLSIQSKLLGNKDGPPSPTLPTGNLNRPSPESVPGRNEDPVSPGNSRQRPFRLLGRAERTMLLKSADLLKDISAEDLSYVAGIAKETEVAAGSSIFQQGDYGDCLYVILEGSVRIHKGGRELAVLGRLQSLGEMAVLDGAPRSASATALEDTTMIKIDREQFLELMRDSPEIIQRIVRLLLARIRETNDRLSDD